MGTPDVAGVQVRAEPEMAVVGLGDHLGLVAEAQHGQHRAEHLVRCEIAAVDDITEDRRRDEVTLCEAATERLLLREAATSPLAGSSALHLKSTEEILLKSIL